jgi:hypothetical protein
MALTWAAFLFREDSFPACVARLLDFFLLFLICDESTFDSDFRRVVAVEESSVDFYTCDLSTGCPEAENDPVGGFGVVATRFPTIVPCSGVDEDSGSANWGTWCDEVFGGSEPFVAEGEDFGSEGSGDEV